MYKENVIENMDINGYDIKLYVHEPDHEWDNRYHRIKVTNKDKEVYNMCFFSSESPLKAYKEIAKIIKILTEENEE